MKTGFVMAQPFLAAAVLIALLVLVGDRGSKMALRRENQCLAALCIFTFSLGTGMTSWFLVLKPMFSLFGTTFALSYPLIMMYWAFWMLAGVLLSAKMIVWDNARRQIKA
jgi:glucan phosphoethanolaminetransferase (alkaline phosphatase superfamily)